MKFFLITIDVEDWFQVENLRPWFPMESWASQEIRVEYATRNILDLLDRVSAENGIRVKATFFTLAWIAQRMPHLVKEISSAGHEVASHGFSHQLCLEQAESELRRDLEESKKLLEDIIGDDVSGYRAPSFSISEKVLNVIRQAGYAYDASYNSFGLNGRYGKLDSTRYPNKGIALDLGDGFYELPLTNLKVPGGCLPCAGGGYFRLFPEAVFRAGVRNILKKQDAYHFYLHPWETDPDQPRQNQASALSRFRHYHNLKKTLPRLENLISSFRHCSFCTCREYLKAVSSDC
ncbi:XrtA system polysaccharide deacetylase [Desulfonatronovibrio hydrogenovorans]|uniref:XrtA system polysaccharide deacetylase n=1 Tax=Desulfonatronovibrio hydrogenovorans TaxID=53245 RepID=UPI0005503DDE|nr:XrtA system polysaccharide deacetylase [Desulfonatronovibrio hydrogenovorans]